MTERRVVVTGIGTINPLGNNIEEYFSNLEKGVSGAAPITHFSEAEKILFNIITKRVDRADARNNYSSSCHKFKAIRAVKTFGKYSFCVLLDIVDRVTDSSDLFSIPSSRIWISKAFSNSMIRPTVLSESPPKWLVKLASALPPTSYHTSLSDNDFDKF